MAEAPVSKPIPRDPVGIPAWESSSRAKLPSSFRPIPRSAFEGTWRLTSPTGPAQRLRSESSGDSGLAVSLHGGSPARVLWKGVLRRYDLNRFVSEEIDGSHLQLALSGGGGLFAQFQGAVAEYVSDPVSETRRGL